MGELVLRSIGSTRRNMYPQKASMIPHCREGHSFFLSSSYYSLTCISRCTPLQPPARPSSGPEVPDPPVLDGQCPGREHIPSAIASITALPARRVGAGSAVSHLQDHTGRQSSQKKPSGSLRVGTDTPHRLHLRSTAAPPDCRPFYSMSSIWPPSQALNFVPCLGSLTQKVFELVLSCEGS